MTDDEEDGGGHHKYDLWAEDPKTRRAREWQEGYQRHASLGHEAELEREVAEFESAVADGAFTDDEQAEIVRKLIKRGVSPDRIGIRREDRKRASQTAGDQQYATDKEMRLHYVEGSPEFEYEVGDRKQLSKLERERFKGTKQEAPVAFNERGLVATAMGGYDLACELLRSLFLILEHPMTKETEHIVSTQILALVQGIEDRLRIALETLIAQLTEAKTLNAKAVGICKICRAEPSNPFVQVILNTYGTKKETITTRTKLLDGRIRYDKRIVRAEPNKQTIRRVLQRLGQTRNRPVSGRSSREKASNLVERVKQAAPLAWVGKDAIMRTVRFLSPDPHDDTAPRKACVGSKAMGRIVGFELLGEPRRKDTKDQIPGTERRWIEGWRWGTFSKSGRQKNQVTEKPMEKTPILISNSRGRFHTFPNH